MKLHGKAKTNLQTQANKAMMMINKKYAFHFIL